MLLPLSARFRALSTLLFVALIATYAFIGWNLRSRILEGNNDFTAYYTAARMVRDGKAAQLYDLNQQTAYQDEILRALHTKFRFDGGLLAYNHPPFEILWYAPLGRLTFLQAYGVWLAVSLGCVVVGVWLLLRSSWTLSGVQLAQHLLGSLAFLPVFINLLQGQDSATLFLFWSLGYWNLIRSREVTAGAWLSLLLQKFQVLLPTLLIVLMLRRWRVLAGFLAGSLALLVLSLALVGPSGLWSYGRLLVEMSGWIERRGIYPSQMQNLRGQFYLWWYADYPLAANALTALSSIALLVVLVRRWRGNWKPGSVEFALKFSLLVTTSLLVSPHLNLHDLSCLLLPGLLIAQISDQETETASLVRRLRRATWVTGFPLMLASLVVSGWIPIHLSVWGMLGMVFLLAWSLQRAGDSLKWKRTEALTVLDEG